MQLRILLFPTIYRFYCLLFYFMKLIFILKDFSFRFVLFFLIGIQFLQKSTVSFLTTLFFFQRRFSKTDLCHIIL